MENQKLPSPVKKRQHQLRALLFNRLGLFDVPFSDDAAKASPDKGEPSKATDEVTTTRRMHKPAVCSQQYLKGDNTGSTSNASNNNTKGGESRQRGGLIRFNSIVSVVAIPSRIQYSNSIRNNLWGSKKGRGNSTGSGSSFDFGDEEDMDSTAGTQDEDDPVVPTPKSTPASNTATGRLQRFMRKQSFHG